MIGILYRLVIEVACLIIKITKNLTIENVTFKIRHNITLSTLTITAQFTFESQSLNSESRER